MIWGVIIFFVILVIILVAYFKSRIKKLESQIDCNERHYNWEISNLEKEKQIDLNNLESKHQIEISKLQKEIEKKETFAINMTSNLTAFPYLAGIVADIETYGYEKLTRDLAWSKDKRYLKFVKSITEIKEEANEQIEVAKEAQYQLQYLFQLYPGLEEIVDIEFSELPQLDLDRLDDKDRTRDYLSKEEYNSLSVSERNQLALDRYLTSHKKTKWQIGRDYENYIGYIYEHEKKYKVEYFGSLMRLEDLGRDLIAKKDGIVLIIQCKYWSKEKQIHEKHIYQLYGTTISYCIEKNLRIEDVTGLLITNISLSDTAKKMANYLGIVYKENVPLKEYPYIKCNIGKDATKIYHLPFDQQYDKVKINKPGECIVYTVKEAEELGFRRAFKWHNN